jgi:Lon protease-like protein
MKKEFNDFMEDWIEEIKSMTPEQIKKVREYFNALSSDDYYTVSEELKMLLSIDSSKDYILEIGAACRIINNLLFCLEHYRNRKFKSTIKETVKEAEYALEVAKKEGWYRSNE